MGSTNFTTHYDIPLPLGSDKTTPMDYNESMQAVDTALFEAHGNAASAVAGLEITNGNVAQNADDIVALEERMTTAEGTLVTQGNAINNLVLDVADVRADGQDMICAYKEATAQSTHAYSVGDYFIYNDVLYVATELIAVGDTIVPDTNCTTTNTTTEIKDLKTDVTSNTSRIVALEKTNYEYVLDNASATINANLVYAASQLSAYIASKNWQTMAGGIEINGSDGRVFGSFWCDRYGTMGGMISAIATTPTAYSYLVSSGVCTLTQLSN